MIPTYHKGQRNYGTGYDMIDLIDSLEERLAAAQRDAKEAEDYVKEMEARANWQPIETAPKDGTRVMLWRGYTTFGRWAEMVIAEWYCGTWCWPSENDNPSTHGEWSDDDLLDGFEDSEFTHWMPLPEPPHA